MLDASAGDACVSLAELELVAPHVVLSRITWFGQTGPYADYAGTDGVCHALIGMVRGIGPLEGPPVMPAGYQAQIVGGLTAYIGTLGQVIAGELGNRPMPCLLDTSILEANMCFTEVGAVGAFNTGAVAPRMGVNRLPPTFPLGIYPCRDGWLGVTALTPSQMGFVLRTPGPRRAGRRARLSNDPRSPRGRRASRADDHAATSRTIRPGGLSSWASDADPARAGADDGAALHCRSVRSAWCIRSNLTLDSGINHGSCGAI